MDTLPIRPMITQALKENSFNETAIRKIMGLNVIQLLQRSLPATS
jgi:microsomal dipeptidase-like Zn-dependent dipeptidase